MMTFCIKYQLENIDIITGLQKSILQMQICPIYCSLLVVLLTVLSVSASLFDMQM